MSRTKLVLVVFTVLLGVVGYGIYIACSSPGREDTVDEDGRPGPKPPVVGPLEPFRMRWDSEANADWLRYTDSARQNWVRPLAKGLRARFKSRDTTVLSRDELWQELDETFLEVGGESGEDDDRDDRYS